MMFWKRNIYQITDFIAALKSFFKLRQKQQYCLYKPLKLLPPILIVYVYAASVLLYLHVFLHYSCWAVNTDCVKARLHHLAHSHIGQNDSALQHEAMQAILNFTSILTSTHTRWRRPRCDEKSCQGDCTTTKKILYTVTFLWEWQAKLWHHSTTRCFPRLLWKSDFVHFHFNWDTRLFVQHFKDLVFFFFYEPGRENMPENKIRSTGQQLIAPTMIPSTFIWTSRKSVERQWSLITGFALCLSVFTTVDSFKSNNKT